MTQAGDGKAAESDLDGLVNAETAAKIKALKAPKETEDFWVLPENWKAVSLFTECSTQWETTFTGKVKGLRYEAVDIVIKRGGYEPLDEADWRRLQVLERTALTELNKP